MTLPGYSGTADLALGPGLVDVGRAVSEGRAPLVSVRYGVSLPAPWCVQRTACTAGLWRHLHTAGTRGVEAPHLAPCWR